MSEPKDDGGPAFPLIPGGMPLRDWFAGQALAALLAGGRMHASLNSEREMLARICYEMADAMLTSRELIFEGVMSARHREPSK